MHADVVHLSDGEQGASSRALYSPKCKQPSMAACSHLINKKTLQNAYIICMTKNGCTAEGLPPFFVYHIKHLYPKPLTRVIMCE